MPKVDFDYLDMFSPILVAIIFAIILFFISFTCINWYCITHKDDLTVFEKFGTRLNLRLGPHSMAEIKRGGYASTYAREEAKRSECTGPQQQQLNPQGDGKCQISHA
ncbi:hypothetical protein niasHT_037811 [Heterodera trifolii]|uniref:ATP synthase F0 subunit 8 n=1 Tax=Heterodera trifolii TaxID=157864 RepID=A0ABD2INA3_9BILA